MEGFPLELFGNIGSGALLAFAIWLILTGRLVPGKEAAFWREAFFEEQKMRRDLELTGKVVRSVVSALPEAPPEAP